MMTSGSSFMPPGWYGKMPSMTADSAKLVPSFDFITTKPFRESLEADYAEMGRSAESKNWKAVQVLAGSIVECLLIDYLAATPNP